MESARKEKAVQRRPKRASIRAKPRKGNAGPPARGTKRRSPPHVLLLGQPKIVIPIRDELKTLGIPSVLKHGPEELFEGISDASKAVVIAPPVPDQSVTEICSGLTSGRPRLPVFAVMPATLPWKSEKLLYDAGATAVLLWPKEQEGLLRALIGLVRVPRRVTNQDPRDIAVSELVRSQTKAGQELDGCRLSVRVIRGVVIMTGTVRRLWQVEAAAEIARSVPGVQDVVHGTVEVEPAESSDREISTTIRKLAGATSDLDLSTLAFDVTDGGVTLAGSVDSALELQRVCRLIREVRGVQRLQTFVTVSPDARKRDRNLARRVQKALALRYPKHRTAVGAFGGVVVLSGAVPSAQIREGLRAFVSLQPGVERVVDKIAVRHARRSSGG